MIVRAAVLAALCLAWAASAATGSTHVDTTGLLARYEPQFEQYAADWKPSAVEPFLAGADLERPTGTRWVVVRHSPPASALANGAKSLRLDTRGCSPAVSTDACYKRAATEPTVYGRVWTQPGTYGAQTVLQYWLFYPLDDWRNSVVRPTLWHMHEGDWEEVSVLLSPAGKPVQVACSQHNLGVTRTWSRVRLKNGTHPYVYIALGSHANYFLAGYHGLASVPHVIPRRFSGLLIPEPDHTSAQAPVEPAIVDVSDGKAPWLSFAGAWGDGNFVLVRGTSGFVHLRVGDSPPGPAFHDVWRDPLLQFRAWPADDGH